MPSANQKGPPSTSILMIILMFQHMTLLWPQPVIGHLHAVAPARVRIWRCNKSKTFWKNTPQNQHSLWKWMFFFCLLSCWISADFRRFCWFQGGYKTTTGIVNRWNYGGIVTKCLPWINPSPNVRIQTFFSTGSILVGGFNPFEKYLSNWIVSPSRGEHTKIFETTT